MMRKTLVSLGAAATMLLLSGTAAQAQLINFGYTADPNVNPSPPSSGPHAGDATQIYNNVGGVQTSSIQFSPASGPASYNGTVGTQFIVYTMTTNSSVIAGTNPYDGFSSVPFNLAIKVTDLASGGQNTFKFSGTYTADTVSSTSSHVNPATQGISWAGLSDTLPIGTNPSNTNTYTMKIISWTAPGAPGSSGSILAEVTVVPGSGGTGQPPPPPPPGGAPEPTSLVLAGLALPALLLVRRRQRKPLAA
jgi:hypothetical protein